MIRKHAKESLVQEAIQLPLKSLERRNSWKQITRLGDFDESIRLMKNLEPPILKSGNKNKQKKLKKIKNYLAVCVKDFSKLI